MLLSPVRITYKRSSNFRTVYHIFNFNHLNYFQIMFYYVFPLGCLLLLTVTPIRSSVLSLIPNPSEDPFFDAYIETVRQMNTKQILSLPKLNDSEFIDYLLNGDDNQFIPSIRVDNSIFDSIRDDLLVHQRDTDQEWETLMVSGPLAVNYMGNLMALASKKDFPFQVQPDYVFRYIRYPQSFRATLTQVSNDMYTALMDAHTAMNRIQLSIQQVPTHVKTALKLITSASDNMMKMMLPRTLESVSRLASDSAAYANATLTRFNLLQELLAEIVELSATTHSSHDASIEKMKEQQLNSTLEQQMLTEKLALIKQQYAESKMALEQARENYYKAMQEASQVTSPQLVPVRMSVPSVVQSAINTVFNPIAAIKCLFRKCKTPTYKVDNTKFENAFHLAQLAKQELERAEQIHNEHFQQQLAEQNELAKAMSQMALLDLAQMSTEEIIQVLLEATNQIHEIREQWARLIQFFSRLAAQASSTENVVVKNFVEVVQQAQSEQSLIDPIEREFFVEILMPTVATIESDAHLLFTMAKTYYAVSSEHMITQIAGIGKFMLLQTDDARTNHLRATSNATMATSYKITQFAQSRHDQYLFLSHQRQEEYKKYIETLALQQLQEVVG